MTEPVAALTRATEVVFDPAPLACLAKKADAGALARTGPLILEACLGCTSRELRTVVAATPASAVLRVRLSGSSARSGASRMQGPFH